MMRYPQALNIEQICVPRSMICPVQIFYCCITWHDIYAAAVNLICKLFCLLLFHFWQFLHIWYLVYFVLIAFPCHPRQMSKVNFPRYKLQPKFLWVQFNLKTNYCLYIYGMWSLFGHYNDISRRSPLKSHFDKHVIDWFMIMFLFRKVRKILSLKFLFFSIFHQLQDVQSKIYTKLPKHLPQYSPRIFFSR